MTFTQTFGEDALSNIARYEAGRWRPLLGSSAEGTNGEVTHLGPLDLGNGDELFVGGSFKRAGGQISPHFARYSGSSWQPMRGIIGAGLNGEVRALTFHEDADGRFLFAGGTFTEAGGVFVSHIGRWNGTTWSPLVGPTGLGTSGEVNALAIHDDGTGPALYVGGKFRTAGGREVNHVAKWTGTDWEPLEGPSGVGIRIHSDVRTLVSFGRRDRSGSVRRWHLRRGRRSARSLHRALGRHHVVWTRGTWG